MRDHDLWTTQTKTKVARSWISELKAQAAFKELSLTIKQVTEFIRVQEKRFTIALTRARELNLAPPDRPSQCLISEDCGISLTFVEEPDGRHKHEVKRICHYFDMLYHTLSPSQTAREDGAFRLPDSTQCDTDVPQCYHEVQAEETGAAASLDALQESRPNSPLLQSISNSSSLENYTTSDDSPASSAQLQEEKSVSSYSALSSSTLSVNDDYDSTDDLRFSVSTLPTRATSESSDITGITSNILRYGSPPKARVHLSPCSAISEHSSKLDNEAAFSFHLPRTGGAPIPRLLSI